MELDPLVMTGKREIQFRKRAVRDMWIIICTIFIVETYTTLYSIVLSIWGNDNCYVQDEVWVRYLSTVVQRSMQYIWWEYPIIYLFWPNEGSCFCCKSKRQKSEVTAD